MDDAKNFNRPEGLPDDMQPGDEETGKRLVDMLNALRSALDGHVREETFGEDMGIAIPAAFALAGYGYGMICSIGLDAPTPERLQAMMIMGRHNFEYGMQVAKDQIVRTMTEQGGTRQ